MTPGPDGAQIEKDDEDQEYLPPPASNPGQESRKRKQEARGRTGGAKCTYMDPSGRCADKSPQAQSNRAKAIVDIVNNWRTDKRGDRRVITLILDSLKEDAKSVFLSLKRPKDWDSRILYKLSELSSLASAALDVAQDHARRAGASREVTCGREELSIRKLQKITGVACESADKISTMRTSYTGNAPPASKLYGRHLVKKEQAYSSPLRDAFLAGDPYSRRYVAEKQATCADDKDDEEPLDYRPFISLYDVRDSLQSGIAGGCGQERQ